MQFSGITMDFGNFFFIKKKVASQLIIICLSGFLNQPMVAAKLTVDDRFQIS